MRRRRFPVAPPAARARSLPAPLTDCRGRHAVRRRPTPRCANPTRSRSPFSFTGTDGSDRRRNAVPAHSRDCAPDQADALHYLGVLLHQRDRSEDAVDLIRRSIDLDPGQPDRYNNLGNVLLERGRLAEAADAYQAAIARRPEHADAWNNLGALYRELGRYDAAADAYQKAIALAPDHVDAYNNYGNLLRARTGCARPLPITARRSRWYPVTPSPESCWVSLIARSARSTRRRRSSANGWTTNPTIRSRQHLYAACSGRDVPARASDAYVETHLRQLRATASTPSSPASPTGRRAGSPTHLRAPHGDARQEPRRAGRRLRHRVVRSAASRPGCGG